MKVCKVCKKEKELVCFNKNNRTTDGYQRYCKECHKQYTKTDYIRNKSKYLDRAKQSRQQLDSLIKKAKEVPCKDCGIQYPYYQMDFDHLKDKKFNIAQGKTKGRVQLLTEINKCEVVCVLCHRERTHKRLLGGDVIGNILDSESSY